MVRVISINGDIYDLFADSASDVTDNMKVIGLPPGREIGFGSQVMTSEGELAFKKSDGTWNWVK